MRKITNLIFVCCLTTAIASAGDLPEPILLQSATDPEAVLEVLVLAGKGEEAVGEVERMLAGPDWRVRCSAVWVLDWLASPVVQPLLGQALQDRHARVSMDAARALANRGEEGVDPLVHGLCNDNATVRARAAWALGRIGEPRAVKPLSRAAGDADWRVRRSVIQALGEIGGTNALETSIQALGDEEWRVRRYAAWALASLGAQAVEPLIDSLGHESERVRSAAVRALAKIGAPALDPLTAALEAESAQVRQNAARALGKAGNRGSLAALAAATLDANALVRGAGATALGEIGDPRSAEPLGALLKDEQVEVRREAANALFRLKGAQTPQPLFEALGDEDARVRALAALALGTLKEPDAVEPLLTILHNQDEQETVRLMAMRALGEIGDPRAVESLIPYDTFPNVAFRVEVRNALAKITGANVRGWHWAEWWEERKKHPAHQRVQARPARGDTSLKDTHGAVAKRKLDKVLQTDALPTDKDGARLGIGRTAMYQRDLRTAAQTYHGVLQDLEQKGHLHRAEAGEAERHLKTALLLLRMRKTHPRLFFNDETWPDVAARAQGPMKERFETWKDTVAERLRVPLERADWGTTAMMAAFVYRVTGDKALLDKIETMLRLSVDLYEYSHEQTKDAPTYHATADYGVSYSPYNRINWVAALDWVWEDLTPDVRMDLASRMIDYVYAFMHRWGSQHHSGGFYYSYNMYWYAGLVLLNDELDDLHYRRALAVLETGWQDYQRLMTYRRIGRGDFGQYGLRLDYTLHHYPYAEWHFLHAWQSAVDGRIPAAWQHSAMFPNGLLWNRLPDFQNFGFDVGWHTSNCLNKGDIYAHVSEHMHFYAESHPRLAAMSHYLRKELEAAGCKGGHWHLGVCPFLLTNLDKAPAPELPEPLPVARYAPKLGVVYMASGFGADDTYAAFRLIGGKQRDSTHFVIYKKGFLALDAGARKGGVKQYHGYWAQTIAHNCVLIRMPGETFSSVYGLDPAPGNAGGQTRPGRSGPEHYAPDDYDPRSGPAKVLAFETGPLYAYVAGDATGTYHEEKCSQMVRQFVYFPPDHFVVFDRVTSTNADYPKRWVVHTANEPQVEDRLWHADQGKGRLFCRTLYPSDAVLQKIGGPGKEFWVDGENYAIPEDWQYWHMVKDHKPGEVPETMGRWRMEVSPGSPRKQDCFLHLLQASGQGVDRMTDNRLVETEDRLGVTFRSGARTYSVEFNRSGEVGGRIRVEEQGDTLINRELTREIMPQEGLALTKP